MPEQIIPNADHAFLAARYRRGETLQQIGDSYGVSRERIRQIISRLGVTRDDGGQFVRSMVTVRYKKKQGAAEARCLLAYGCSKERVLEINGGKNLTTRGTPAQRYADQRRNARVRGIAWEITLPEWWEVWSASGRWEERGRGSGYVMTRVGDTGPYSKENVEIKTGRENSAESYYKHPVAERIAKRRPSGKSFCIRGHELTPATKSPSGNCRECSRLRNLAYRQRKAAAQRSHGVAA